MVKRFVFALLMSLAGCSDVVEESYGNWAEAERAGAVERGWIPLFVPTSAQDIHAAHDLDTNYQKLTFTVAPAVTERMVASITPISKLQGQMAEKAMNEAGWNRNEASTADVYLMCTHSYSGALVVDKGTGRAIYMSPVEWARDYCPRPL